MKLRFYLDLYFICLAHFLDDEWLMLDFYDEV